MGVCSSKNDGRKTAAAAAKTVDKSGSPVEEKLPKLLVIGSGGSGKSTLRKQFCLLYGKGYDENDRRERIPIVHYNIVASLKILCAQSLALKVEVVHPDSREFLLNWQDSGEGLLSLELLKHVQTLWKDEGIQHTYEQRHTFPQPLPEHAKYFLDKAEESTNDYYLPSDKDMLRCSARTTGIVELNVVLGENKFLVFDVGGQRAERKKWVHCMEETACLIYVAGVSGYDEQLLEDPEDNRLSEELKLFEGVCGMFPTKPIILILNKIDILRDKLSRPHAAPFSASLPEYRGEDSYDALLGWIRAQFLARNKFPDRGINVYTINATDPDQVRSNILQMKDVLSKLVPPTHTKS